MTNNSTKILFMMTLLSGVIITISSNSWLGAWMGLEINLLSFIPIMYNNNNTLSAEASLKYFMIQALASSCIMFTIIVWSILKNSFPGMYENSTFNMLISPPLLMKAGGAPFHWWFPSVMEGLNWLNCLILMTIQKLAPLTLISYLLIPNLYNSTIILLSALVGSIGGYNQISMRKILTYSSINHLGWMIMAMSINTQMWIFYFKMYTLLVTTVLIIVYVFNISFINQLMHLKKETTMKFLLLSSLLSLGGLPPFLGFYPKWMIIQNITSNNQVILMLTMVMLTLLTLYYYLRITYSSFLMLISQLNWEININQKNYTTMMVTIFMSLWGLLLCKSNMNTFL
uniref:NADH dehydrogenase subunit 2 n=1 Tax=Malaccina discoidalis TaxID=3035031 RepID=UPI00279E7FAC|nr:NADH dehydrogenase subunit 2 [Malaccina discoidalis]WGO57392.1 NADH dehydrogenase subunit 2 [Malaccina discoidalis]